MNGNNRNFSDQDITAIADEMEKRIINHFYNDLGRGVWGMVRRALIIAAVAIAAYGSIKGVR